jgi:hypothetical protein
MIHNYIFYDSFNKRCCIELDVEEDIKPRANAISQNSGQVAKQVQKLKTSFLVHVVVAGI